MTLLHIDFMKVDPSKDGKENVLVMTDALSKFSVTVLCPTNRQKQEPKPWWISGFTLMVSYPEFILTRVKV